jgi:hypothetical protein
MNPLTLFLLTAFVFAFLDFGRSIWSESVMPQRIGALRYAHKK